MLAGKARQDHEMADDTIRGEEHYGSIGERLFGMWLCAGNRRSSTGRSRIGINGNIACQEPNES
jgi:hypothetical protein